MFAPESFLLEKFSSNNVTFPCCFYFVKGVIEEIGAALDAECAANDSLREQLQEVRERFTLVSKKTAVVVFSAQ